MNKFGEIYETIRKKSDQSTNVLAKKAGIDPPQVNYWSNKGNTPDKILALIKIAKEEAGMTWEAVGKIIDKAFK